MDKEQILNGCGTYVKFRKRMRKYLSDVSEERLAYFDTHAGFLDNNWGDVLFINPDKNLVRPFLVNSWFEDEITLDSEQLSEAEKQYHIRIPQAYFVEYGYHFGKYEEDKFFMSWTIQPDGRYYADEDGFGAERQTEIILHALINDEGKFITPFRVYSIGGDKYKKD